MLCVVKKSEVDVIYNSASAVYFLVLRFDRDLDFDL